MQNDENKIINEKLFIQEDVINKLKIEINGLKNNNIALNKNNKNITDDLSKLEKDRINLNTEKNNLKEKHLVLNDEYKKECQMRIDFEEKYFNQLKTLSSNKENITNLSTSNDELNKKYIELEHQVTEIKDNNINLTKDNHKLNETIN